MRWTLVAALLVGMLGGASAAEATASGDAGPARLWIHLNGYQEFPITAVPPPPGSLQSDTQGLATNTVSCADTPLPGLAGQEFHTLYGYFAPWAPEYDGDRVRANQQRGLSHGFEVLDGGTVWWHLLVRAPAVPADAAPAHAPIPNVVVQATMRSGDSISVGNTAYNEGEVVLRAKAGPVTLAGAATGTPPAGSVAYEYVPEHGHVYSFGLPVEVASGNVTAEDGANLRMDVFLDNPACGDPSTGYVMPNAVVPFSADGFRPAIDLRVTPRLTAAVQPRTLANGTTLMDAFLASAFGPQDVANVTGWLETPTGIIQLAPAGMVDAVDARRVESYHGHVVPPLEATFLLPPPGQLPPGTHTFHVSFTDLAGDRAEATAPYEVPGEEAVPAAGPAFLAMALCALAVGARRRR